MKIQHKITLTREELLGILNSRMTDIQIPDDAEVSVDTGEYYKGTVEENYPLEITWDS
jgi:hypothetical protein